MKKNHEVIRLEDLTPRSPMLVALYKRHGSNAQATMKDRRRPRGGNRNVQREYREERY
jgi:hypothetical protein